MLPFGGFSPVLIGAMRDSSGSYKGALLLLAIATVLGASFLAWVKAPRSISLQAGEAVES
jgi:cyanate permease